MSDPVDRSAAAGRETWQILRFGIVGIVATGVHLCIALTLNQVFGLSAQVSNLCGFLSALAMSFLGHHSFSFRSTRRRSKTLPRFVIAAGSGYIASALLIAQLQSMELHAALSLVFATCVIPAVNYIINRLWVF